MIIEVLGRPKEHLVETLENLATQIDEERGVEVISKKINEPKEVDKEKDLYTSFMEIEIEVNNPNLIAALMFKYMPAHVEVVEPEKMVMSNNSLSDLLNEITRRLHKYDELAKVMQAQNQALNNKLKSLENKK